MAAIDRLAKAEAVAVGAERQPDVSMIESFPAVVNDVDACEGLKEAFATLPNVRVEDPGEVTGSEDVGILAIESNAPCAFWLLGGSDPARFAEATSVSELAALVAQQPSNHSPFFAPVPEPTLSIGVSALVAAAKHWLKDSTS